MLINVPLNQIDDNPYQKRQDYGDVAALAADIQANGLLQTPVGRLVFDQGQPVTDYDLTRALRNIELDGFPAGLRVQLAFGHRRLRVQLAFGHRRLRAYRELYSDDPDDGRWATMPIEIHPLDDDAMLNAVWAENQNRSDINPIEQAELLAEKLGRLRAAGGNQQTLADQWRLDRSTIANKIRLLDLPPDVQTALRDRRLSERQALALLSVVGLEKRLNGSGAGVQWAWDEQQMWRAPLSPTDFIAHVVANPDDITSDKIRDYVTQASRHAGAILPDLVATTLVDGDVVQPLCKGCPRRHDQYCLLRECLHNKQHAIAEGLARAAAAETGLPYSDDPKQFERFQSYQHRDELHELYDAGITVNLVIGYNLLGSGPGPYRRGYYGDPWLDNGRPLVVLGHRLGKPTDAEHKQLLQVAAAVATDAGKPPSALTSQWEKRHKEIYKVREIRGRSAVSLVFEGTADRRLIRLLYAMFATDGQRDKEVVTLADMQKMLWERARARPTDPDEWRAFLTAAGLPPDAAEPRSDEQRLRERVIEAADGYFAFDSDWRRQKYAGHVIAACAALDAHPTAFLPDDIASAADWLRRALPQAQQIVAADEEE